MEREIIFRGKRTDNGKWVYGDLYHRKICGAISPTIHTMDYTGGSVIPTTIGQYTGLKDKNGTRIFEGDIINFTNVDYPDCEIIFDNGSFVCNEIGEDNIVCELHLRLVSEVIGNVHDNPELLKGGER